MENSVQTVLATAPAQKRRRLENGSVVTAFVAHQPVVHNTLPTRMLPVLPSIRREVPNMSDSLSGGLYGTTTQRVGPATPPNLGNPPPSVDCSSLIPLRAPQPNEVPVSYSVLDAATHAFRLAQVQQDHESKGTGTSYSRHVRHYVEFWDNYQAECCRKDPRYVSIPTFLVTAAKVAMFLQQESTREKVAIGVHVCVTS
jgi:hypothetical protein